MREHFSPHALEMSEVREVSAPIRATRDRIDGQPSRIRAGIEQVVGDGHERGNGALRTDETLIGRVPRGS